MNIMFIITNFILKKIKKLKKYKNKNGRLTIIKYNELIR